MKQFRDSNYWVTQDGKIFKHSIKEVKQSKMTRGYLSVSLFLNSSIGKTFYVHRIIAEVFIPNTENKPLVNHINGNKKENCVKNLEWVTYQENSQHSVNVLRKEVGEIHSRAIIPDRIVRYIRECKIRKVRPKYEKIAEKYGITITHLKNIYAGRKRVIV
jgi:hypothetical protein